MVENNLPEQVLGSSKIKSGCKNWPFKISLYVTEPYDEKPNQT